MIAPLAVLALVVVVFGWITQRVLVTTQSWMDEAVAETVDAMFVSWASPVDDEPAEERLPDSWDPVDVWTVLAEISALPEAAHA